MYGTSEFNFEVLKNPPEYEPTQCSECGAIIVLGDGGYICRDGAADNEYEQDLESFQTFEKATIVAPDIGDDWVPF